MFVEQALDRNLFDLEKREGVPPKQIELLRP